MKFILCVLLIGFSFHVLSISSEEGDKNATEKVSDLYFNIQEIQTSLSHGNVSEGNLLKFINDLSATLVKLLSELESARAFEEVFTSKFHDLQSAVNETRCSLSTRIIDIENEFSALKSNALLNSTGLILASEGVNRIKISLRPKLVDENFVFTPYTIYHAARNFCRQHNSTPFVPKTKDELNYIIEKGTVCCGYYSKAAWLPLEDIYNEGVAEWEDGTFYQNGTLKLQIMNSNSFAENCVSMNSQGRAYWTDCLNDRYMICYKSG